jgi:NADH-quinone oxidoreductase subunit L
MTPSGFSHPSAVAAILATMPPFAAFLSIMIGTRSRRELSAGLSIGAVALSFASSLFLLAVNAGMGMPLRFTVSWVATTEISIPFGFMIDPLSLLMLIVVTAVCLLVQIYSLGYMAGDPGFSRYFAFMSLFAWAMTTLTLSANLIQLYIFWELVGLCSYLLIGFWYEKFSATQAGKKAFVMTRVGDVSFFLGILLVIFHVGNVDIADVNAMDPSPMGPGMITFSALLIFGGIVGKSAQFPLLTWLPDAMEGPTPVSALLHSATMVAAGVFLFGRLFPFFSLSPTAMTVFLAVGTVSMLLSSTMAMVSRDIKQVWAYSTISQLGYMIMGLAAGGYVAGIFHLTTHAGFKALLFLCSGVLIHHYETNDMFEIGSRGGRSIRIPMACFVIAAAALSGIPPLSGFFSKEMILVQLAGLDNPAWLAAGLLGAFLTAYYAFRLIFAILFPRDRQAGGKDHHRDHPAMLWPLIVLAASAVLLGFFEKPIEGFLTGPQAAGHGGRPLGWLPYVTLVLTLGGILLAWVEFGRRKAPGKGFVERIDSLYDLFSQRWYLDRFYLAFVERVVDRGLSRLCTQNDNRVVDGTIDGLCSTTVKTGRIVSLLHAGMIQYRLMVIFAVLVFLALYFLLRKVPDL